MKTKKSERANLDKKSGTFLLLGLALSLLLVFYAFEMKTKDSISDDYLKAAGILPEEDILQTKREKILPPAPKINYATNLKLVDHSTPDVIIFIPEFNDTSGYIEEGTISVTQPTDVDEIIPIPQFEAEFPGGVSALFSYLEKTLKYPSLDVEVGNQGTVFLKFVVRKDGSVDNIEVVRGVSETIDNEAKRVVAGMPKWKPARMGAKAVHSYFTMPILFKLN